MRSWTWWLRHLLAFAVACPAATLPGMYAFVVAELLTDPALVWMAICVGVAVYGFVFAVVFTVIADGPRQLVALVHRPSRGELRAAPGSR